MAAMALRRGLSLIALAVLALAAGVAAWLFADEPARERAEPLGLFTSLPIYWSESAGLSGMLDGSAQPHWARGLIEERRSLQPLDVLSAEGLDSFEDILLAQPRTLSPTENVALDGWVRGGGRLLLFADPLLTQHSSFAIGDKRRPQDAVLLSPILSRWGLELQFDDSQQPGEHIIEFLGGEVPVDLPGRFLLAATTEDAPARCELLAGGIAADCTLGKGRALILADAALLDGEGVDPAQRARALSRMMAEIYAAR